MRRRVWTQASAACLRCRRRRPAVPAWAMLEGRSTATAAPTDTLQSQATLAATLAATTGLAPRCRRRLGAVPSRAQAQPTAASRLATAAALAFICLPLAAVQAEVVHAALQVLERSTSAKVLAVGVLSRLSISSRFSCSCSCAYKTMTALLMEQRLAALAQLHSCHLEAQQRAPALPTALRVRLR